MKPSEVSDRFKWADVGLDEEGPPAVQIALVIGDENHQQLLAGDLRTLGYEVSLIFNSIEELESSHQNLSADLLIIEDQQIAEGEGVEPPFLQSLLKRIPAIYLTLNEAIAPSKPERNSLKFPSAPRDLLIKIEGALDRFPLGSPGQDESLNRGELNYRTLWEQDVAGNAITARDGSLIDCNDAFIHMLGYQSVEELQETRADQLYFDPTDRLIILEAIHDQGKLEFYELRLRRKDGEVVHCIANLFGTFDRKGELVQVHSHFIDYTRQKRLEEQLRYAHKMEAIGRLTGGIAHDFNNLLTAILGYSELLLRQIKDKRLRGDVEQICDAADRAGILTRQLLAYSRRQVLQPQALNLNRDLQDMEEMLGRVISSDIQLQFSLSSELHPIHADPGQIQQITLNMVANGRDAMPRGGQLVVETENLILEGETDHEGNPIPDGSYVRLAVQDSGTGIERSVVERMFDPYFTTKGLGRGSGLGLATVYGIVKQSNGYLRVHTLPGHWTLFEVFFPAIETSEEKKSHLLGRKVLFVLSDDQKKARLVYSLLTQEGFLVLEPARSSELPSRLSTLRQPVDLWILDTSIPHQKVSTLERLIHSEHPGSTTLSLWELAVSRKAKPLEETGPGPQELITQVRRALTQ